MAVGSTPTATIFYCNEPCKEQGITQNPQVYPHITSDQGISLKQAIQTFILSCKVEGKSYGTIECYTDKLKGVLWYAQNYHWPDNVADITTNHLREFLSYLRDTEHRFNSNCSRAKKPINSTTVQKYYRALSVLFNWLIDQELLTINPLAKIKVPKAEKKVIKALDVTGVNDLIATFGNSFEGKRNKAIVLILVDCGLRLGELLNLKLPDVNMEQQLLKVDGKTGERIVRFGSTTAKALLKYTMARQMVGV